MSLGFEDLAAFQDKRVVLKSTEGEIMRVRIAFVSRSEQDVLYELLSTNHPERYPDRTSKAIYSIPFEFIADVRPAE